MNEYTWPETDSDIEHLYYPRNLVHTVAEIPTPTYADPYETHENTTTWNEVQSSNSHLDLNAMSFATNSPLYLAISFCQYGTYPPTFVAGPLFGDYTGNPNTVHQSVLTMPPDAPLVALPANADALADRRATTFYHPPGYLAQNASPTPGLDTRYQKSHACEECGKLFDRHARARDHAYKDRGETPHYCGGECGKLDCDVTSWSEEHLEEHIKHEKVQCSECACWITKKNIARHRTKSCPNRFLVGASGSGTQVSQ